MATRYSPEQLVKQFGSEAKRGRRVAERLQALVDQHFREPSRRDARGRTAAELAKAGKTLRQLVRSIGWQCHPDPNIRQKAKALVKTTAHAKVPFEELMASASELNGQVIKCGRRRAAQQPIAGCEPLRVELPEGFSVERLHTRAKLANAGRLLGNCVKDNGHRHHDRLRGREADFYLVWREGTAVATLDVELDGSRIRHILGPRNDEAELPRSVLFAMLSRLRLNGDDVEECRRHGLLHIFLTGEADRAKPQFRRRGLRIWQGHKRLAVWERQMGGEQWSSLTWDGNEWDPIWSAERQGIDDLMTRHPEIAVIAREAAGFGTRKRRGRAAPGRHQPASR